MSYYRAMKLRRILPDLFVLCLPIGVLALSIDAAIVLQACGSTAGQVVLKAGECVLDSRVIATVLADLASDNFAALINASDPLVACALTAIASGQATTPSDAGSAAPDIRVARARQLLAKSKP